MQEDCAKIANHVEVLKDSEKHQFGYLKDEILLTLKFHAFNDDAEDVKQFGDKSYLDTSPFEHLNYIIKQYIRSTSGRHNTSLEEIVEAASLFFRGRK